MPETHARSKVIHAIQAFRHFAWFGISQLYANLIASILPKNSPCRTFRKKKSLACYKLRFNLWTHQMEHYEIYRIVNRKKDEYYVFPMETLQGKDSTHLSYHRSGKFHWRFENEAPIVPRDGEADFRNADLISQAVDHLTGALDGYCLAICPGTPIDSVRTMLKILDGYVIPSLERLPAGLLLERQNLTLPLPMVSPQKRAVQMVFSDAKAKNEYKENSKEEIEAALRKQIGPDAKVIHLDPTEQTYVALGDKYMMRIFEIAQSIVAPKLGPKGPQFWTK